MELARCSVVVEGEALHILSGDQRVDVERAAREANARVLLADAGVGMAVFEQADSGMVLVDAAGAGVLGPPRIDVYGEYRTDWSATELDAVMAASDDPLADAVLAAGDPELGSVRLQMPSLKAHAFLADARLADRPRVHRDGRIDGYWEIPLSRSTREPEMAACRSEAVVLAHRVGDEVSQFSFLCPGAHGEAVVWLRRRTAADREYSFLHCGPAPAEVSAGEFYAALLGVLRDARSTGRLPGLSAPEADLLDGARTSLRLGMLTSGGVRPRYGMGEYDQALHNSFPPTVISAVEALLAWGELREATQRLLYYLYRYVREDGTLDYYGPSVAEHGQLLCLAAEIARKAGAVEFVRNHLPIVRPIWSRLLAVREKTRGLYPSTNPHHGLIPGLPEADYHHREGQWEQFYYAGDLWVCRAMREWGRTLSATGLAGCVAEGDALLTEADAYREDILRSLAFAGATEDGFVPPGPDQQQPLAEMTPETHASYCNYRYLPEMASSGELPGELMWALLNWRRGHRGELLGTTRFKDHLDDWPVIHVARALLETDQIEHYLLLMYAHLAHHHDPGTLLSFEQVSIATTGGVRVPTAGQVAPCQFTVPTMLAWAMAYADRDEARIWLMRGVPAHWWDEPGVMRGPVVHICDGQGLHWGVETTPSGAILSFANTAREGRNLVLRTRGHRITAAAGRVDGMEQEPQISANRERLLIPSSWRKGAITFSFD